MAQENKITNPRAEKGFTSTLGKAIVGALALSSTGRAFAIPEHTVLPPLSSECKQLSRKGFELNTEKLSCFNTNRTFELNGGSHLYGQQHNYSYQDFMEQQEVDFQFQDFLAEMIPNDNSTENFTSFEELLAQQPQNNFWYKNYLTNYFNNCIDWLRGRNDFCSETYDIDCIYDNEQPFDDSQRRKLMNTEETQNLKQVSRKLQGPFSNLNPAFSAVDTAMNSAAAASHKGSGYLGYSVASVFKGSLKAGSTTKVNDQKKYSIDGKNVTLPIKQYYTNFYQKPFNERFLPADCHQVKKHTTAEQKDRHIRNFCFEATINKTLRDNSFIETIKCMSYGPKSSGEKSMPSRLLMFGMAAGAAAIIIDGNHHNMNDDDKDKDNINVQVNFKNRKSSRDAERTI